MHVLRAKINTFFFRNCFAMSWKSGSSGTPMPVCKEKNVLFFTTPCFLFFAIRIKQY